jgi:hypothetical protein
MIIFHMHTQLCINILVCNKKWKKILKKNKFSMSLIKQIFWQDYFLHMWLAPKTKHFEFIEHNVFAKWFLKWVCCLATLSFKILKF